MHSKQYVYTCIGAKSLESTDTFFMFVNLMSIKDKCLYQLIQIKDFKENLKMYLKEEFNIIYI